MLPQKFVERIKSTLGVDAEGLLYELENGENVRAFRVNTNKISVEDFDRINTLDSKKIPHIPDGYYTNEEKPGNTPEHHAGMIYMQDPSAMSAVCAIPIEKGMKILDCCAAPGGKSSQLSAYVGEDGVVVSNEYVSKRAAVLQGNLERMGARSSVVTNLDARELYKTYREYFDVVVCDAPCSGEGMFRKNQLAISEWSPENVEMCAKRQTEIINSVEKCVAVGGLLMYSTCTFSLEENEMVVDRFLSEHENFELIDVNESIKNITSNGINFEGAKHDLSAARRFYPHVSPGEGQFISLMRKACSSGAADVPFGKKPQSPKPSREETQALRVAREFLEKHLTRVPDKKLVYRNGTVRLCPDCPIPEYGVLMRGVCVGEAVKGRLVPHHQLFSAYGELFKNKINLPADDVRLEYYIKGMEIELPEADDGYGVLMCDGCALGGVKVSSGRGKNHYPKGLRQ